MIEQCGLCKFWAQIEFDSDSFGRCKRFPPKIDPTWMLQHSDDPCSAGFPESTPGWWVSPVTWEEDCCGEFKPVNKTPPA